MSLFNLILAGLAFVLNGFVLGTIASAFSLWFGVDEVDPDANDSQLYGDERTPPHRYK